MRLIKILLKLISWLLFVPIIFLAFYFINSSFSVGGYQSFVVQSGSMEPAIMTGDIIVSQRSSVYGLNDVITFHNNSGDIITHRIVAVDKSSGSQYSTKGDANRTGDDDLILDNQVIGKVVLVIPRLGYAVGFSKTPLGLIFLLLIPVVIFALDGLEKVLNDKSSN